MDSSSSSSPSNWEEVICVVAKKGTANFSVPKSVLVTESPVFKDLLESANCHEFINITVKQTQLQIPDVDANVFDALLQYLYSKTISQEILDSLADKLLTVTDKYKIESLKIICEKALVLKISSTNVIDLLLFADQTSSSQLKWSCIAYVIEHSKDVTQTDKWIQQLTNTGGDNTKLIGELYRRLTVTKNNQKLTRRGKRKNKRKTAFSDNDNIESNTIIPPIPIKPTTTNTLLFSSSSSAVNNQVNRSRHWFHDDFVPFLGWVMLLLLLCSFLDHLPWWVSLTEFVLLASLSHLNNWVAVNISQINLSSPAIGSSNSWFEEHFVSFFGGLIFILFYCLIKLRLYS